MVVDRSFAAHSLFNQFLTFLNSVGDRGLHYVFTIKTGHIHILVCRDDDSVGSGDLFLCQNVGRTLGSIGLRFYRNTKLLSQLLQILSRHKGVGETGRTLGHGKDTVSSGALERRSLLHI